MAQFRVVGMIGEDTFEVSLQWQWGGQLGSRVRPTGYDALELDEYGGQAAKDKLSRFIPWKAVDLRTAYRIARGRLVCAVFINRRNLADCFPEYQGLKAVIEDMNTSVFQKQNA